MPVTEQSEQTQHALPAPEPQKALPEPRSRKGGSVLRKLALLLILLLAGALAWWKYRANKQEDVVTANKTAAAANRAIPVTVAPVVAKTMPIYLSELGTVTAYNTVTVKSRVDGQLLSVNVREGQQVKQGQVIAMIDPRPYQATVAQAEGQLAKDQAQAEYARAEAQRYTSLYQAGVVSKDSQQVQASTAGQSAGTLEADRAAIQAAKVNVAYTRITSPINGVVGLRQVDAGNIVHAADTTGLIVVTQLQPISVIFTIPEDQLPSVLKLVRGGHKLVVEAFDRSETKHLASGTLLTVDNEIDPTTGTVKAKAVFENKDGALFPNQFVNIRLILEQRENSLVLPAAALQTGANGSFVYVVKPCPSAGCPKQDDGNTGNSGKGSDAKGAAGSQTDANGGDAGEGGEPPARGPKYFVDVRNVTTDLTEGSQVILKSGVNPGDQVVIDGQEKLKKNSKVTPKQGRSNAGGPSTQAIGSDGSTSAGAPQASSPDQGTPEPGTKTGRSSGQHSHSVSSGGGQP